MRSEHGGILHGVEDATADHDRCGLKLCLVCWAKVLAYKICTRGYAAHHALIFGDFNVGVWTLEVKSSQLLQLLTSEYSFGVIFSTSEEIWGLALRLWNTGGHFIHHVRPTKMF